MFDNQPITHPIQKYILKTLTYHKYARFRDMRKPNTDSNLYSYHLKTVIKDGFVEKVAQGYRLTAKGLAYVDRLSQANFNFRIQPKIITMILLKNTKSEILLTQRNKQPFITRWTLPSGKIHVEDEHIVEAAQRELNEKIGFAAKASQLSHIGDAYIHVRADGAIISCVLAHIFAVKVKGGFSRDNIVWTNGKWRQQHKLATAVEDIIKLSKTAKTPFFTELKYDIDLNE